jgi:hypothetical protein
VQPIAKLSPFASHHCLFVVCSAPSNDAADAGITSKLGLNDYTLQLSVSGDEDAGVLMTSGNNVLNSPAAAGGSSDTSCSSKWFVLMCVDATGPKIKVSVAVLTG